MTLCAYQSPSIFASEACAADMLFVDPDNPQSVEAISPEGYRGETREVWRGGNLREYRHRERNRRNRQIRSN